MFGVLDLDMFRGSSGLLGMGESETEVPGASVLLLGLRFGMCGCGGWFEAVRVFHTQFAPNQPTATHHQPSPTHPKP